MKVKHVIFFIIVIILLALTILIVKNINLTNISHNNQYTAEATNTTISSDDNVDADELINKLINSEKYSKMSDDEKIKACETLLKELKEKKAIKDYFYSSTDMLYSFEYKDGSLGGIKIKDWDPNFN